MPGSEAREHRFDEIPLGVDMLLSHGPSMPALNTKAAPFLGTRPNISEYHSEISTRVRFCIAAGSPHDIMDNCEGGFRWGGSRALRAAIESRRPAQSPQSIDRTRSESCLVLTAEYRAHV